MYIKEIELNNFRIYKGVNRISLMPKDEKNIVIVSGQNGFGKTTFLMSLVWCLYGKNMEQVDAMYKKEIDDKGNYTKYIADSMNRKAVEEGETEFSVKIAFSGVNVQNVLCDVVVKRSYNIITGTSDKIEVLISEQPQELIENLSQDNQKGEEIFIRDFILPIAIAKFFFFDAEKITSLAEINQKDQRRQLSQAYSEVLGIQKYETLKNNLEDKLDEYRKKSAKKEDKQKLIQLEADIEKAELDIEDNENKIKELKEEINQKKHESDDISLKLVKAGDKMSLEELTNLREEKSNLEQKKNIQQEQLKGIFDFIPFALAGETLSNVVEQIENERLLSEQKYKQDDVKEKIIKIRQDIELEKPNSKVVFDRIQICDFYEKQIEKLVKKYFYSDVQEIDENLKIIHDFSANQTNEINQLISSVKNNFKYQFESLNNEYSYIKNQLDSINRKIRDAEKNAQDNHIADLRDKKEILDQKISEKEQEIGSLNQKIDDLKEVLKKHRQDQTAIRKQIDDSAQYSEKEQKTKQLIKTLEVFITKFKGQKKESLQAKMLDALTRLLHKKDFVQRVDVDILTSEDIDINLYDKSDKIIDKSGLSMGERQLYASALLSSLVSESEIDFPVFIDSPMQKFDNQHAENIIKHFYPNVAKQVVIYPLLHKELTENEYKLLQSNVCKTFLINNTSSDSSEFLETEPDDFFSTYNQISNAN
ncbi:MAG: DNA sulfur modification protein DndD [Prevotellaceae bacterium]|jgi:DNA sulfur modification protein DndD|nr:DNA sulfur modification protein DndD [Prevotellaceae bacterium]